MSLQKEAQKRIKEWKGKRMYGHEIAKLTGVDEAMISRIFKGGTRKVSEEACQKILAAKEPM